MRPQRGGIVVFRKSKLLQNLDGGAVDNRHDVPLLHFPVETGTVGNPLDRWLLGILSKISLPDFLKIEGDLVIAEIPRKRHTISVGDFAADSRFAHRDGGRTGNLRKKLVAPLDLEIVEA